jgi:GTP-binding protein Era
MEISPDYRCGYVAIIGRPNVGKSTLLNKALRQKVASVSPRPQTTRRNQLGILTEETYQAIFMDTPGIHQPVHKLGEFMNQAARDALQDADVILWIVDASQPPHEEDRLVAEFTAAAGTQAPVVLALNKADLSTPTRLEERQREYSALLPCQAAYIVSAQSGQGVNILMADLTNRLPPGPPMYDLDQITDLYEKEIAADFIREAAMLELTDELPHAIGIRVDEYHDIGETKAEIFATLFVERESQKPIVIGKGAAVIKKIGEKARREIETLTGRKVFLELRVKVMKNWRNDPGALRQFGYQRSGED